MLLRKPWQSKIDEENIRFLNNLNMNQVVHGIAREKKS